MSNENSLADVDIDQYEKDLIIETLQYRLEHDDHFNTGNDPQGQLRRLNVQTRR